MSDGIQAPESSRHERAAQYHDSDDDDAVMGGALTEAVWEEERPASPGEGEAQDGLSRPGDEESARATALLAQQREAEAEGGLSRDELQNLTREAGRAEARRLFARGELPDGASVATPFNQHPSWGTARIREVEAEGGLTRRELVGIRRAVENVAVWEEIRRAHAAVPALNVPESGDVQSLEEAGGAEPVIDQRMYEFLRQLTHLQRQPVEFAWSGTVVNASESDPFQPGALDKLKRTVHALAEEALARDALGRVPLTLLLAGTGSSRLQHKVIRLLGPLAAEVLGDRVAELFHVEPMTLPGAYRKTLEEARKNAETAGVPRDLMVLAVGRREQDKEDYQRRGSSFDIGLVSSPKGLAWVERQQLEWAFEALFTLVEEIPEGKRPVLGFTLYVDSRYKQRKSETFAEFRRNFWAEKVNERDSYTPTELDGNYFRVGVKTISEIPGEKKGLDFRQGFVRVGVEWVDGADELGWRPGDPERGGNESANWDVRARDYLQHLPPLRRRPVQGFWAGRYSGASRKGLMEPDPPYRAGFEDAVRELAVQALARERAGFEPQEVLVAAIPASYYIKKTAVSWVSRVREIARQTLDDRVDELFAVEPASLYGTNGTTPEQIRRKLAETGAPEGVVVLAVGMPARRITEYEEVGTTFGIHFALREAWIPDADRRRLKYAGRGLLNQNPPPGKRALLQITAYVGNEGVEKLNAFAAALAEFWAKDKPAGGLGFTNEHVRMVWRTSNAEVRERKAAGLPGRHVRAGLLWLEADDNVANQAGGDVRWEHAAPESVEERAARAETKLKAARIRRGWTYDDAARALADAINDAGGEPVTPNYLSKRLMRWDFGTPVPAEYRPFLREIFGLTDVEIGSSGLASAGAFEVQAHEPADAALIEDDVVMGGWSEPESGTGLGADGDVAVQWDPQPGEDVEPAASPVDGAMEIDSFEDESAMVGNAWGPLSGSDATRAAEWAGLAAEWTILLGQLRRTFAALDGGVADGVRENFESWMESWQPDLNQGPAALPLVRAHVRVAVGLLQGLAASAPSQGVSTVSLVPLVDSRAGYARFVGVALLNPGEGQVVRDAMWNGAAGVFDEGSFVFVAHASARGFVGPGGLLNAADVAGLMWANRVGSFRRAAVVACAPGEAGLRGLWKSLREGGFQGAVEGSERDRFAVFESGGITLESGAGAAWPANDGVAVILDERGNRSTRRLPWPSTPPGGASVTLADEERALAAPVAGTVGDGQRAATLLAQLREAEAAGGLTDGELAALRNAAAWEVARRAWEEGRPHTAASLGAVFDKSKTWGSERLREVEAEGGLSRRDVVDATRQVALEEARRALA
ncbi:hypothetical protein, partial [Saccharopolyspora erythraea]|uniref:hypothetical protein n=1 Tax=Saccharopolyspora erythraea TaxID=1836 RepID=UPI0012F739BD